MKLSPPSLLHRTSELTLVRSHLARASAEVSFAIVAEMHESDCPPESELARKKVRALPILPSRNPQD